jgi:hypothetical protein
LKNSKYLIPNIFPHYFCVSFRLSTTTTIVSIGNLVDSPTRRVGESFFDYEYLCDFEAKIGTAPKVVKGIYEDPIYAKTQENPPHCHVPLISPRWIGMDHSQMENGLDQGNQMERHLTGRSISKTYWQEDCAIHQICLAGIQ